MTEEPRYDVVWPLGPKDRGLAALPPRLGDLRGKRIAEVWDWVYDGDRAFPLIREELKRRYPGLEVVDYTHFGNIHGGDERAVVEDLPRRLREHGCDAVIVGVGH